MSDEQGKLASGNFGIRYELLPDQRLRVWYRFDESPEVGPSELERSAADELGTLIERAAQIFSSAQNELEAPSDDHPSRAHTDPSALRRRP